MQQHAGEALRGEPEHEADDEQRDGADAAAERQHDERRDGDAGGGRERDAGALEEGEEGHRRGTGEGRRGHDECDPELAAREQAEGPRIGHGVPEEGLHQHPRHAERAAGD